MAIDDNTSYELTGYQVKDLAQKIRAKADSNSLASVATSGLYSDLTGAPTIPTVYNGTLTIQKNGVDVETFTANSSTNKTANITVPTTASEVNALPDRSSMSFYGTCVNGSGTAEKAVVCPEFTAADLVAGTRLIVHFSNSSGYNGVSTLNVNNTGAKNIVIIGTSTSARYMWLAGESVDFVYNGTEWVTVNGGVANTTYYGVTKLNANSTSDSVAYALAPRGLYRFTIGSIAPYYDDIPYAVGDRVRHGDNLYECNTTITTGEVWDETHWTQLPTLIEMISNLEARIKALENRS